MRLQTTCSLSMILFLSSHVFADETQPDFTDPQITAIAHVEKISNELKQVNQSIWEWAEVGLEERKSSRLLQSKLTAAGFKVETGLAGMPTAFVASFGSGKPVIGILAEYDALPGLSQKISPQREAAEEGKPGHACGHSGLGTGALGAALAVRQAMEQHGLPGTIRLYGTPAEETVIGKVYMTLDGVFDDLDICLHWHPGTKNEAWSGSSKALVSAKFTFHGTAAHASVSPASGRSALDGVELMNVAANFMREHIKEDARLHYVIVDGGGAPNVVAPQATVWYFCRADSHEDTEYNFRWLNDIAEAAAKMSRTRLTVKIDTDCHEVIPNSPLSALITTIMQKIGAPKFTDTEMAFARRLQEPLVAQFGRQFPLAIDDRIHRVAAIPRASKGSTDVGDISWRVPTGGLRTACLPAESPGHSWQNVASIGSSIGEKGIIYSSKILAVTAIELMQRRELIAAARSDWQTRMKDKKYFSFIPDGQQPPKKIR
ncbi:MAG TPA: amidohydrolase [Planctomycetes bacterium]|nr:amidohydrolase [Planctomycetaceae bacterium]HIM30785.1 amidohydrolase [Planctomycetota bacterium]